MSDDLVMPTRGPWTVGPVLDTRTFDAEASSVVLVQFGNHTDIAYVAHMATDGDTAEQNANARLIAAAPELLDALRLILPLAKCYAPQGQSEQARQTCNSWIAAADEVLERFR